MVSNISVRKYKRDEIILFRKTKEEYGGLSNMASGYPITINNIKIYSSEALYQACRYPHLPNVQREIFIQRSPMTAKMKSKKYRKESRVDWEEVKIQIMRWALRVKLLQNWEKFSALLLSTGSKDIVEYSTKDDFWGAKPFDTHLLIGVNALGRLLMELRQEINSYKEGDYLLKPPNIDDFQIIGEDIPCLINKLPKIEFSKVKKDTFVENSRMSLFDFER